MYIASRLNEEEITEIRNQFKKLDRNGDGIITKDELQRVMSSYQGLSSEEAINIINGLDFNGNGYIDYTEFITGCLQTQNYTNKGLLKTAFKYFDIHGSGYITFDELKEALHGNEFIVNGTIKIEEMIKEADSNNDGKIDYIEFLHLLSVKSNSFFD